MERRNEVRDEETGPQKILQRELVSVETLAELLDVKERTVREWVAKKVVPYHKLGRLVRFNLQEVRKWYHSREVAPFTPSLSRDKMV